MRRVVHLRISASAVYGCFELQRKKGMHPEHKKLSTVVTEVIESTINTLRNRGELGHISDEEADIKLSQWLASATGPSEMDVGIGIGDIYGGEAKVEEPEPERKPEPELEPEEEDTIEDNEPIPGDEEPELSPEEKERIAREMVGGAQSYLESETKEIYRNEDDEESDDNEPVPIASRPPWEEEGVKSLEDLGNEAGRDHIYDRIMSSPDASEADKRALQVVYSKIPRELWGTERAESLIEGLKPHVERHLQSQESQD